MRVLILSQYYPPEPLARLHDLSRFLVARGHSVIVVTTFPSYPHGKIYSGYRARLRTARDEDGVRVIRVWSVLHRGTARVTRVLNYLSFALSAFVLGMFSVPRPDVVFVYHPPLTTGAVGALYGVLRSVPFVFDVHDLWPEGIVAAGMLREHSAAWSMVRKIERFIYKRATRINVIAEGMKQNLIGKGVPEEKLRVISNWGDPDNFKPINATVVRERFGWSGRFIVMVAGNLGLTHGLETVIEAAGLLRAQENIQFVFMGTGSALQDMHRRARSLLNVTFQPRTETPADANAIINAADVLLIHLRAHAGSEFSVPHRLFSYMHCVNLVIVAAQGSTAAIVIELRCGWTCPPSNPEALSQLVLRVAANPGDCHLRGTNGLQAAKHAFDRTRLLEMIEESIWAAASTNA